MALSFLPLAHVYERTVDYGYLFDGVPVAYVEQMESVPQALLEVKPTLAAAVPRFFEKIYANIIDKGHRETGIKAQNIRLVVARSRGSRSLASLWQGAFVLD